MIIKMNRFGLLLFFVLLCMYSCNTKKGNSNGEEENLLCQRNVYSRNGVDSVVIKEFSPDHQLQSTRIERYDSLGNCIYYLGNGIPKGLSYNYISAITKKKEIELFSEKEFVFSYSDSTLLGVQIYYQGEPIAYMTHKKDYWGTTDSVYVDGTAVFVLKEEYNMDRRIARKREYSALEYGYLSIVTDLENTYYQVGSRSIKRSYRNNVPGHDYEGYVTETYDDAGRVILEKTDDSIDCYVYDEIGNLLSHTWEDYWLKSKGEERYFYYQNNLLKKHYGRTNLEYSYSFHDYSMWKAYEPFFQF